MKHTEKASNDPALPFNLAFSKLSLLLSCKVFGESEGSGGKKPS